MALPRRRIKGQIQKRGSQTSNGVLHLNRPKAVARSNIASGRYAPRCNFRPPSPSTDFLNGVAFQESIFLPAVQPAPASLAPSGPVPRSAPAKVITKRFYPNGMRKGWTEICHGVARDMATRGTGSDPMLQSVRENGRRGAQSRHFLIFWSSGSLRCIRTFGELGWEWRA
jgi:hypothetical protein